MTPNISNSYTFFTTLDRHQQLLYDGDRPVLISLSRSHWQDRHWWNYFSADRFTAHPLSLWQPHQVISDSDGVWQRQYVPLDAQRRPRSDACTGPRTCQQQLCLPWGTRWEQRNTGRHINIVLDQQRCAILLHRITDASCYTGECNKSKSSRKEKHERGQVCDKKIKKEEKTRSKDQVTSCQTQFKFDFLHMETNFLIKTQLNGIPSDGTRYILNQITCNQFCILDRKDGK